MGLIMSQPRVLGLMKMRRVSMSQGKITVSFEIESDQADWINEQVEQFGLPDESKAMRILLDYALEESDTELIFSGDNTRCRYCG